MVSISFPSKFLEIFKGLKEQIKGSDILENWS